MFTGLTDQIRRSTNNPLTTSDFDVAAMLDDVLSTVGLALWTLAGEFTSTAY